MSILSGVSEFFGLDIGTSAVRVVELRGSGPVKSLVRYGQAPVEAKLASSDAKVDQQRLAQVVKDLLTQTGIATKNVAVGIPSHKVFTAVFDVDRLAPDELAKTIQYQEDSMIPTPLAESKVDWVLLGDSPADKAKVEILLSSVANDFVEARLDMLESIGLNVIAFEPDNIAVARALLAADATLPQMVIDMGRLSTDLVISMAGGPRLTRSIPTGVDAVLKAAAQNLNVDARQAEQFVFKFGLSKDKLDGQIFHAIVGSIDILASEIDKSIKFFQTRYPNTKLERIVMTGGASILPEFPLYIANKFGTSVEIGNAWRNVAFDGARQNELLTVSNHFGVAVGLAERQA
jgi:type IV pilus assembly protein PilM